MDAETLKRSADAVEAGQRHPVSYEAEALRSLAKANSAASTGLDGSSFVVESFLAEAQVFATLHAAGMTAHLADIVDGKP